MAPILVTSYVNPDLDGVASAVAYAEFLRKSGRNAVAAVIGEPHDEVKYVLERFHIENPKKEINADNFSEVILVDTSDVNALEGAIVLEKVIEIIDHREVHEAAAFKNAAVQIELVGSAATLIGEKFLQNHIEISRESATLLYAAIASNTLNFQHSITTDRDIHIAAQLNEIAQLPENFWREMFAAKSDFSGNRLADRIEGDFAWFVIGAAKIGIAQIEMLGAKKMIVDRGEEIAQCLDSIKSRMQLNDIFLNTIELEGCRSYLVANDVSTKQMLEKILGVQFSGMVAERSEGLMRKQIVPLLKEEFLNK